MAEDSQGVAGLTRIRGIVMLYCGGVSSPTAGHPQRTTPCAIALGGCTHPAGFCLTAKTMPAGPSPPFRTVVVVDVSEDGGGDGGAR